MRVINDKKWIVTDKKTISPHEINREDFIRLFELDGSEPFLNYLLFEPDGLQNLSIRERETYDIVNQMSEQDFIKFKKEYDKKQSEGVKETEDKPIVDLLPFKKGEIQRHIIDIDETYDDAGAESEDPATIRNRKQKTVTKTTTTSNYKKQLGDEGESETFRKLKERYPQDKGYRIKDYRKNHKAYDFKVVKNNETIKYIDSKYSENGTIELSPSQVDAASKYQDKYEIYAYIGSEQKYSIIVNPFEKFTKREIASGITFMLSVG